MLINDLRARAQVLDERAAFAARELMHRRPPITDPPDTRFLDQLERTARVAQDAADSAWRLVADTQLVTLKVGRIEATRTWDEKKGGPEDA